MFLLKCVASVIQQRAMMSARGFFVLLAVLVLFITHAQSAAETTTDMNKVISGSFCLYFVSVIFNIKTKISTLAYIGFRSGV